MSSQPLPPNQTGGDPANNPLALLPTKFDGTLGALLVGGLAATALWGITCVQTFSYFNGKSSRDKGLFKTLIAFLWFLDTFDTILNCHILYFYLVSNFANPLSIAFPVWSVLIHVAVTSISNFIIRSMFARRAYRLSSGNIPITVLLLAVSLTDLVVGIVITARAFKLTSYLELDVLSTLFYVNFAAGTSSDLGVALTLCYLLRKSRTGFARTDSLIKMLMTYTINTGLIVAVDAALGMICYIVMPNNFVFLGFYLLLSKLYLNSYLASLNAREGLRDKINSDPKSINLSDFPQFNASVSYPSTEPTNVTQKSADSPTVNGGVSSQRTTTKSHTDEESAISIPKVGMAY
ncbi:hypothetical protein L218DRAFT_983537 [Marasmius fiardii PR-910]|nr:hypothetical protein L218DRAFT_983537 [Marasmius fiardii PR-910]